MVEFSEFKLAPFLIAGAYGMFGAFVQYLYQLVKDDTKKFQWSRFFLNGVFGFFIGQVVGNFIPHDFVYRDGTLLISGFLVYQILNFIEVNVLRIVFEKYTKK